MKNLIKNLAYKSFMMVIAFPLTLSTPLPSMLDITKNVSEKPKEKVVVEKITSIKLDTQKPQMLIIAEKQISVKMGQSNVDAQIQAAQNASQRLALRNTLARENTRTSVATSDPGLAQKRQLAKQAAAQYGIPWQILEAVWQVETGKSWDTGKRSYAGATGPMQFMPGTWRKYAADGNGDGVANINSAHDSVYAAAKYLAASGASSGQIDKALYSYNHSTAYVAKVKTIASGISE